MNQPQTQKQNLTSKESEKSPKKLDLTTKKELAKVGMAVSMGVLVLSGFNTRNKFSRNLHIISGAALVGLSYYHTKLYENKKPKGQI